MVFIAVHESFFHLRVLFRLSILFDNLGFVACFESFCNDGITSRPLVL
nr:MAG TPA: hypothetical protein [Caudoviricetes sp.]